MKSKRTLKQQHEHIAFQTVVQAILRQFPLQVCQVRVFRLGVSYGVCPRCNSTLEREYVAFCDRCGQRLGWELLPFAEECHK